MSRSENTKNEESLDFSVMFPILQKILGIKTHTELAERLGIKGQAISNAKHKGKMPLRWIHRMAQKNLIPWESVPDLMKSAKAEKEGSFPLDEEISIEKVDVVDRKEDDEMSDIPIPYGLPTMTGIKKYRVLLEMLGRWVDETFPGTRRQHMIAWIVEGDNMEPVLPKNSMVLIDTLEKSVTEAGIYAFQTNGGMTFRRILPRLDGNVDVLNDNRSYSSYNTPPATLTMGASKIIGRVIFKGGRI